jgi:hypothetical protein
MKRNKRLLLIMLFVTVILISCKKSDTPTPKDYAASVNDKTWSGEITYAADSVQFYTVHFNADNSLLWSQLSGDYPGNWGVIGKQLTMTFTGSNAVIQANLTDDDKMANISVSNTNAYIVNSAVLVVSPNLPLEGTVWKGSGYFAVATYPFEISFLPGNKAELKINNFTHPLRTYTRSSSGTSIRIAGPGGTQSFAAIISATEINGSSGTSDNPFKTTKK